MPKLTDHLKISDENEYIPIHARRPRTCIHNPTCYDQTMFVFDTMDHYPCPLLHFCASPICLMVQAQPHLANAMRLVSDKANVAEEEITTLLKLYQRRPGGGRTTILSLFLLPILSLQHDTTTNHPSQRTHIAHNSKFTATLTSPRLFRHRRTDLIFIQKCLNLPLARPRAQWMHLRSILTCMPEQNRNCLSMPRNECRADHSWRVALMHFLDTLWSTGIVSHTLSPIQLHSI